jgi:ABC-type uncharacterized transport system ATPase subunit
VENSVLQPAVAKMYTPVVQMRQITKRFPGVLANDHIDFDLKEGEVHALLGENGSGKTTLMNILYGLLKPDEGEIYIDGKEVSFHSPSDAIACSIGMVHQNFKLIPNFTAAENVALCLLSVKGFKIGEVRNILKDLIQKYEISEIELDTEIQKLPVHEQQLVEILKMLSLGQKILIFDEPTSVLAGEQIGTLLNRIRRLAETGHSIIFISHKLDEVLAVSDRITVARKGKIVGSLETNKTNKKELITMMIGRGVGELSKPQSKKGAKLVEVKNLQVFSDRGIAAVEDASFSLYSGEILGIAGVAGNGQLELAEAITGVRKVTSGEVIISGCNVTNASAKKIIDLGVSTVPPKPKENGVASALPITENVILRDYSPQFFNRAGFLKLENISRYTRKVIAEYNVVTTSENSLASFLSGGNLMKLIVAREIARKPKVFIISDPTSGLDVGSIEFVHKKIIESRESAAILLISTDLDEVLSLSDRVAVIFKGRVKEAPEGFNREKLGMMMTGEEE